MDVKAIVGLGNPGHTYHETRHNVGFAVIEALAARHRVELRERLVEPTGGRPAAVCGRYRVGDLEVRLVMPLTMMNDAGSSLAALDVASDRLLVVCDDVNLPLGRLRIRAEGGAGGHHGLSSCLAALGTEAVARLRVGIGSESLPEDLTAFVLSTFSRTERPVIREAVGRAADACEAWVGQGIEVAMNQFNAVQQGG